MEDDREAAVGVREPSGPAVMIDDIVVVCSPAGEPSTANVAVPVSVSPLAATILHALRPA